MEQCVFCEIVAKQSRATIVAECSNAIIIEPLNPVVDGHLLVIPKVHVKDFMENPLISALTMEVASKFATGECNLITSAGPSATQTIMHMHIHIVPRYPNDNLALPWSNHR